jgi:pSer/pThr/pTyr-binding forkhead associated (FHA) protein
VSVVPRLVNFNTGEFINLVEGDHVVSREPGSPYSFPSDASISRNHASLNFENGVLTVTDLGSTNGTYVNSVRMSSPAVLKTGDQILVGATTLRIEGL